MTERETIAVGIQPHLFRGREIRFGDPTFPPGTRADGMILEVLRLNPDVAAISYSTFNPIADTYDTRSHPDTIRWLPRTKVDSGKLRQLSFKALSKWEKHDLYDPGVPHAAFAINSLVKSDNGTRFHIPMLALCLPSDAPEMEEIRPLLRFRSGTVFGMDGDAQFWGTALMTHDEWCNWMTSIRDFELARDMEEEPIVDLDFMDVSLKHGYAALPVYGDPGDGFEETSFVVPSLGDSIPWFSIS